jgi:hypothetical protein
MKVRNQMPKTAVALPSDITETDLKYPDYKSKDQLVPQYDNNQFELWYTQQMGWCIPTLRIGGSGRYGSTPRTYATTLDGKQVRIGKGPHVLRTVTVYVRQSRVKVLQKYLDLRTAGAVTSNTIRDRISSRRAQGQVMRAEGRHSWLWDAK